MEEGRSDSVYSSGEEDTFAKQSLLRLRNAARWREQSQYISFEPALLLLCFVVSLSEVVLANHIILEACIGEGLGKEVCQHLSNDTNATERAMIETKVQPLAANITMTIVIIKSVVPVLSAVLLGAWSDRYGRKPAMLIASAGLLVSYVLLTLLAFLSMRVTVNPWYYTAAYLPLAILGGMTVVTAAAFSYLSDVANEQNRTVRMGFMEAAMMVGALLGFISSSYILEWFNVAITFAIATGLIGVAVAYIIFFTEDSIILSSSRSTVEKLCDMFSCDRVREIFATLFSQRSRHVREMLWAIVILTSFIEFAGGTGGIFYMYTRRMFGWDLKQYSYFQFTDILIIIVGNVVGLPILKKVLHCSDTTVALLSIASYAADSLMMGFATKGWVLYLATSLTVLKGTDGAALLTICSSILPSGDMAKFFTLAFSLTAIVPLVSAPVFTFIYESTLQTAPQVFNFVAGGFFVAALVLMMGITFLVRRFSQPELLL
ncbi:proton-coupled folate transporter-like [Anopheles cruzii]|uniref:proton-coupled folate transporter-like n=1 Tax=Anopheles cruzii TaxID=68878 RepID=UPI0022EC31DC|nr:proton-coupled folate transporter-like [Anopheles cruzii]